MSAVKLVNLSKSFGTTNIINNINLTVEAGEFVVLVGPSGCGKSTLLRMISGLENPSSGQIFINGKDQTTVEPQHRDIAMVFQSYALYPHMNVFENMAFSLRIQKIEDVEINKRIKEISELLKIDHLLQRKPKELSGGQRQRVSLGRALVRRAPVILFDEPLSNLDAHLRSQMRLEIKKIHQHFKSTIIYVTHDQTEAMTMGDRIVVLNKGNIEQVDSPEQIYNHPMNTFVANFIGTPEMNIFEGSVENKKFKNQWLNFDIESDLKNNQVFAGIRPEHFEISTVETGIKGQVIFLENLGPNTLVHVNVGEISLRLFTNNQYIPRVNDSVFLTQSKTKVALFDKLSGKLI
jgi:ABC-type sugar transport system ATPase subunit